MLEALLFLAMAATDPAPAAAPYEVIRAGDRAKTCEVLLQEVNGLNAELQAEQNRQAEAMNDTVKDQMGAMTGGVGSTVASSLAGLVPFGGQALSMARQAQVSAAQRKMADEMTALQQEAMALGPKYQRLDYLMDLYNSKAC
ncbi:hypothetical protein [Caulobacter sp. 17J80-11]|uniref:hypothetical protein n=1 Tax=Caulobacter sp. 17J80-11 TaxID=2763502 RepID=UPI00165344F4|nr:hypothetical protein [Caulobacter sp. 17J80-11]MBC6980505.1 hypothetical protein [Caulobacter sp. 17J80-11]